MISETMIKFWTKLGIQIFLQFCWRTEKVNKVELLRVLVKRFGKSHRLRALYIFGYYLVVP